MALPRDPRPVDPVTALERRVASNGAGPLLTWYDLDQGFRTELSGRTFANWVDKSANLLVSMDVENFPRVANTLLVTHPTHWVGLVWAMATWQLGGETLASAREGIQTTDLLDAAVVGPDEAHPMPGVETIACSLHPMGAGFDRRLLGVTDYAEVLSQPDVHWRVPAARQVCFRDPESHGWDELLTVPPSGDRRLIVGADDPWQLICQALVAPLLGGGSTVLVSGGDQAQIESVASQERARLG